MFLCVYANCGESSARHRPFRIYIYAAHSLADGTGANFLFSPPSPSSFHFIYLLWTERRQLGYFSHQKILSRCVALAASVRQISETGRKFCDPNYIVRCLLRSINTLCSNESSFTLNCIDTYSFWHFGSEIPAEIHCEHSPAAVA